MLSTIEHGPQSKSTWDNKNSVSDDEILFDISGTQADKITRKGATWIKGCISEEKRSRLRTQTAFDVEICPLDEKLEAVAESQPAVILNYSQDGVCLEHSSPIPEQYVSITWRDSYDLQHIAIVRLKWCRSTEDGKILSGGQVRSMETIS